MAALVWGRLQDTFNTVALAALVILLVYPPALCTISFQLSFAAVLAIVYGLEKIGIPKDEEISVAKKVFLRIKTFVLLSGLAVAGTAPLALFHFNRASVIGIAANLLLIPIIGFFVVPLGLLSASLAIFFEPASLVGFSICLDGIGLALALIDLFAAFPFGSIAGVAPSILEMILYYVAGWSLLHLRSQRFAVWLLALTLVVAVGDGLFWSYKRFWHRDLAVTAIDVGQGGATLLELPGGKVILYDGGGFSDNRFFDVGKQVVAPFLWRKKIATVDTLILSHPNADHLNGLIYIAEHFHVRELWTNKDVNTTIGYRQLMNMCELKGIAVRRIDSDFSVQPVETMALDLLHPPSDFFDAVRALPHEKRNDGSLVFRVTMGGHSFLLTGDIEAPAEMQMVKRVISSQHHSQAADPAWWKKASTPASSGVPSSRARALALVRSLIQVAAVVWLKPKRCSITKVA